MQILKTVFQSIIIFSFLTLFTFPYQATAANPFKKKEKQKKEKVKTKPSKKADTSKSEYKPDPQSDQKVKQLVSVIEAIPRGTAIVNDGYVEAPPDHQPYNPDGTRNQNFKVNPDPAQSVSAIYAGYDKRRAEAVLELIKMGPKAVDELSRTLVNDALKYHDFYAYALLEIKDVRAAPAFIKILDEGKTKKNIAGSARRMGNIALSEKLEKESTRMINESTDALKTLTGQDFGDNHFKWQDWWKQNEAELGPAPKLLLYTANPPSSNSEILFDPALLKFQDP
jgi:hypothetical protein